MNIQDFLVTKDELGDWEGEEEIIADKLNELLHFCWTLIPDEMDVERIEQTLCGVWDNLRGDTVILDVDMDQLQDWVITYVHSMENAEN